MGIEARDEVKWLQHYIDELNGKVDLTVALIHEGVPARQSSQPGNDVRRALDKDIQSAGQVKGLDVLITGHAHVLSLIHILHHFYQIVAAVSYRIFMKNVMLVKFFDPARKRRLILQSDRHPAPTRCV